MNGTDRIELRFIGQLAGVRRTFGDAEKAMMTKLKPDSPMTPQVSAEIIDFQLLHISGELKNPGAQPN